MQRYKWQWTTLAIAAFILAAGCAARSPAQRPEQGFTAAGTGSPAQSPDPVAQEADTGSTTGDADACAATLGNTAGEQAAGETAGAGAQNGEMNANGVLVGNVAVVVLPTTDAAAPGGVPATKGTAQVPGAAPAAPGQGALDRIRQACTKVVQIRVVTDGADREQLARLTRAIRRGEPITDYLDQLARISLSATPEAGAGPTSAQ